MDIKWISNGLPLPLPRLAPSLTEIPHLHAFALPKRDYGLHSGPFPRALDAGVELQYVPMKLDCVLVVCLENDVHAWAARNGGNGGSAPSAPAAASGVEVDFGSWQWDGSEEDG